LKLFWSGGENMIVQDIWWFSFYLGNLVWKKKDLRFFFFFFSLRYFSFLFCFVLFCNSRYIFLLCVYKFLKYITSRVVLIYTNIITVKVANVYELLICFLFFFLSFIKKISRDFNYIFTRITWHVFRDSCEYMAKNFWYFSSGDKVILFYWVWYTHARVKYIFFSRRKHCTVVSSKNVCVYIHYFVQQRTV
jgi:hypothetical protein